MTQSRDAQEALRQARAGFEPSDAELERVAVALESRIGGLAGLEAARQAGSGTAAGGGGSGAGGGGAAAGGAAAVSGGAMLLGAGAVLGIVVAALVYVAGPYDPRAADGAPSNEEVAAAAADAQGEGDTARAGLGASGAGQAVEHLAAPVEMADFAKAAGQTAPVPETEGMPPLQGGGPEEVHWNRSERPAERVKMPKVGPTSAGRVAARAPGTSRARSEVTTKSAAPEPAEEAPHAAVEDEQAAREGVDDPPQSLRLELRLIEGASRALRAGEGQRALGLLRSHLRGYPEGVLRVEREALFALASCATGNAEQARSRAQRFLRDHPSSPLASRVQGALHCDPATPAAD